MVVVLLGYSNLGIEPELDAFKDPLVLRVLRLTILNGKRPVIVSLELQRIQKCWRLTFLALGDVPKASSDYVTFARECPQGYFHHPTLFILLVKDP